MLRLLLAISAPSPLEATRAAELVLPDGDLFADPCAADVPMTIAEFIDVAVRAANELMAPPHSARYTAPDQQYLRITPAELESFVTGPLASAIGAVEATGAVRSHRGRPERLVSRALGSIMS